MLKLSKVVYNTRRMEEDKRNGKGEWNSQFKTELREEKGDKRRRGIEGGR